MYGCGLRISEALNIKRNNFPFKGTLKIVGKGGKERIIPVVPFVEDSIKRYIDLCPFVAERNEYLFLGARKKVRCKNYTKRNFKLPKTIRAS